MFPKVQAKEGSANPVFLVQAIRNTSSAIVPSVIREIEIWRLAVLMINRYADEAEANSFRRAEELAAEGDHARAAIWRRVTVAIEQLTDTTGPLNCQWSNLGEDGPI
jgi:hypothetical protein